VKKFVEMEGFLFYPAMMQTYEMGTAAQTHAKCNNISFVKVEMPTLLLDAFT
jgi:hypothetical protein